MSDPRMAAALEQLRRAWGEERLAAFLDGLAAWAGPLAEAKASQVGDLRVHVHQGRLKEARITEDRRIA